MIAVGSAPEEARKNYHAFATLRDCPYSRDFRGDFCVSPGLEKSRSVHVATIACAPGAQGGRSYGIQQPGSMFGRPGSIQVAQTLAQSLRRRGSVPLCSGRAWAASRRAAGAENCAENCAGAATCRLLR